MESALVVALIITAIGMTLLFLALALFYGLLSLMMSVFGDRARPAEPEEEPLATTESVLSLQAAAIAVALARAQAGPRALSTPTPVTDKGLSLQYTSPWWMLHHQHDLTHKPNVRRRP